MTWHDNDTDLSQVIRNETQFGYQSFNSAIPSSFNIRKIWFPIVIGFT